MRNLESSEVPAAESGGTMAGCLAGDESSVRFRQGLETATVRRLKKKTVSIIRY